MARYLSIENLKSSKKIFTSLLGAMVVTLATIYIFMTIMLFRLQKKQTEYIVNFSFDIQKNSSQALEFEEISNSKNLK
jgi:hypothetical protein